MGWKINQKEFDDVFKLSAPERYGYFIEKVSEFEEIWGLRDEEGWFTSADNNGQILLPVWPHIKYASAFVSGEWLNGTPTVITLENWLNNWLPGFEDDGTSLAVFLNLDHKGAVVTARRLLDDIIEELEYKRGPVAKMGNKYIYSNLKDQNLDDLEYKIGGR